MRLWIDHNYGCSTVILCRIYVGLSWLVGAVNRFSGPDLKIDLELYARQQRPGRSDFGWCVAQLDLDTNCFHHRMGNWRLSNPVDDFKSESHQLYFLCAGTDLS